MHPSGAFVLSASDDRSVRAFDVKVSRVFFLLFFERVVVCDSCFPSYGKGLVTGMFVASKIEFGRRMPLIDQLAEPAATWFSIRVLCVRIFHRCDEFKSEDLLCLSM